MSNSNDNMSTNQYTITLDSSGQYTSNISSISSIGDITIGPLTSTTVDTITISGIDYSTLNPQEWVFTEPIPFETGFPNWNEFQDMCKEYPGLEKTLEHLKVFYRLCIDEWEAKKRGET